MSYLPCSPSCEPTALLANQLAALLPEPIRTWHRELLSFPTLYTSLHGVAEITTPLLRVSVPTDALADKVEVRYEGTGYPAEGAKGLVFPFSAVRQDVPATSLMLVLQNPADNGFSSREAQTRAHEMLLAALAGRTFDVVVDLGCGDGALLKRVSAKRRVGIEIDPTRAETARTRARLDRVEVGDCTDAVFVARIVAEEKLDQNDLVIAQRDRIPVALFGHHPFRVLDYSYDDGAPSPKLLEPNG